MPLSLLIDIVVAGLLVAMIGYAISLNRRLALLRQDRDELERLAAEFAGATARADDGVRQLKRSAEDLGKKIDERIQKAESLRDDLVFLIERGDTVADRLESTLRAARKEVPAAEAATGEGGADPVRSEAELELFKALQSVK